MSRAGLTSPDFLTTTDAWFCNTGSSECRRTFVAGNVVGLEMVLPEDEHVDILSVDPVSVPAKRTQQGTERPPESLLACSDSTARPLLRLVSVPAPYVPTPQYRIVATPSTCAQKWRVEEDLDEEKLLKRHERYEKVETRDRLLRPGIFQKLLKTCKRSRST